MHTFCWQAPRGRADLRGLVAWLPHRLSIFHKGHQLWEVSHQLTFHLGSNQNFDGCQYWVKKLENEL